MTLLTKLFKTEFERNRTGKEPKVEKSQEIFLFANLTRLFCCSLEYQKSLQNQKKIKGGLKKRNGFCKFSYHA